MSDFRGRDMAPLNARQWEALDEAVVQSARSTLVGRRFLPVFGPLGPGFEVIPNDVTPTSAGIVDLLGEEEHEPLMPGERRYEPLRVIHQDFVFHWRDLEASQHLGVPLDPGLARASAVACARAEDELIFRGLPAGPPGLLNVQGHLTVEQHDWTGMGNAFRDVVAAVEGLIQRGFAGPFALAASPDLYVSMNRMFENTGVLEIDQVKKIARGGVFAAVAIPRRTALVLASGGENADIVVGVDMTVAYTEASKMNHHFRVLETLALRIKRPESICTIEGGASSHATNQSI